MFPFKIKHHVDEANYTDTSLPKAGPITATNAAPELIPKTATATVIANWKLLLAVTKDNVAVFA
jgi:hypothetical protein